MQKGIFFYFTCIFYLLQNVAEAQINEDKTGAWYMYFFNTTFNKSSWGIQGDLQYRNQNTVGDLEQLLLRGGATYKPKKSDIKLTFGYGNITTGSYGSENTTKSEHRLYQEALFPVEFGNRFYTSHRFRYEQRFVENQDFRTRYRYNLFLNIPLNKAAMDDKTIYLAFYNEIFINGQRNVGNGNSVEIFDRNRLYLAMGYILKEGLKIQMGYMKQSTDNWRKSQFQFSFHQKI